MADWKQTIKEWLHLAGKEVKKTTKVGQKMLQISRFNSEIEDIEKSLGKRLISAIKDNSHSWDDQEIGSKIQKVDELNASIQAVNNEIQEIKKEST